MSEGTEPDNELYCAYCGCSFRRTLLLGMSTLFGARTRVSTRCSSAPYTIERGPRGGRKRVKEHRFDNTPEWKAWKAARDVTNNMGAEI